ncbi:hypothetical protein BHE74_00017285 [Ensete ventricosum]|nr:hypothetical protein BHE74_00017285 [Ensete ventricosum]
MVSSSSMDEKTSKALEAMLWEHDEDSIISNLSYLTLGLDALFCRYESQGDETINHGQALRLEPSQPSLDPIAETSATREVDPPAKKMKVLMCKEAPHKDAPPTTAPMKATLLEVPRKEGNNRWRDKVVFQSRSMRDLCRVRACSQKEPFLAWEIADLLEMSREGLLEDRWATLTPRSKVWVDGTNTQLFCRGVLCPLLAKESYTTPSEALLDNAAKNMVIFRVRYPQLEIKEDPYTTLREDDNVPMEAKVPFDDSDPPAI